MLQRKRRNNFRLIVLTLLHGQLYRVLRTEKVVHHEADEVVGEVADVEVGAVVGEVEAVVEVAVARKASPPQSLRNRAEKNANAPLSLTVALILVSVVRLSPRLRLQKKQKQMLHRRKLCVLSVQSVLLGDASIERQRLL
jgi:hypothetical protein